MPQEMAQASGRSSKRSRGCSYSDLSVSESGSSRSSINLFHVSCRSSGTRIVRRLLIAASTCPHCVLGTRGTSLLQARGVLLCVPPSAQGTNIYVTDCFQSMNFLCSTKLHLAIFAHFSLFAQIPPFFAQTPMVQMEGDRRLVYNRGARAPLGQRL